MIQNNIIRSSIKYKCKKLIFLGIETSCDETAASIVQENLDGTAKVLSNIISSQIKEHKKFENLGLGVSFQVIRKDLSSTIHFKVNDMQIAEDSQLVVGHLCMQWLTNNKPI